jgi:hypothetical protein
MPCPSHSFFINAMMILHKFSNEKNSNFLLKLKPTATNPSICYVRCMVVFLKTLVQNYFRRYFEKQCVASNGYYFEGKHNT